MATNRIVQHKEALVEALEQSLGVITTACLKVGVSRDTFYRYMRTDEGFALRVKELENVALDFAESQLFKNIKDGKEASVIFFLKTKGRGRGYIEKSNVDLTSNGEKIERIEIEIIKHEIVKHKGNESL